MNAPRPSMPLLALTLGPAKGPDRLRGTAGSRSRRGGDPRTTTSIAVDPAKIGEEARGDGEAFEYGWEDSGSEHEVVVTAAGQLLVEEHQSTPPTCRRLSSKHLQSGGSRPPGLSASRVEAFEVEVTKAGEGAARGTEEEDGERRSGGSGRRR